MIVMVVLGAIGVFCRLRYGYDERMAEHEAEQPAPSVPARRGPERRSDRARLAVRHCHSTGRRPRSHHEGHDPSRPHRRPAPHRRSAAAIWGWNGACSALLRHRPRASSTSSSSAAIIAVTARISLGLMMGAVLFGYLIRLGLILVAVLLVKDASWISRPALGTAIIVTHLGLLALGAQVRRHLARLPRPQALLAPTRKERSCSVTGLPGDQHDPALAGPLPDLQQGRADRRRRR